MTDHAAGSGSGAAGGDLPPVVRGRYLPLSLLGEGASTRVYRAYDVESGHDVALQILRDDPELGPIRSRFLGATRAVIEIRHPAVVACYDAGETTAGEPFAVMELLRGETLGAHLARVGRLPWRAAVSLFLDAASGLAALHEAGLVHRDVKPDNLFLVGPLGAPERLKVLDFGLSKRVQSGAEPSQQWVVGTTEYMPPEQVLCDPVDARSDVYALGAVLFRALTGELPFAEVPRNRVLAHHLVTPAPPPSWLVEDLPPGLAAIVATSLRKHPDNRFEAMEAMACALGSVADGDDPPFEAPRLRRDPDRYEPRREHASEVLRALGDSLAA